MENLKFNKRSFFRTLLVFVTLSLAWTYLCIQTNEFTDVDKGLISGLGFLLLFSTSFYQGQRIRSVSTFTYLTIVVISLFLLATFVLGPFIGNSTNSMTFYAIANSILTATTLTITLDKLYGIEFKYLTIAFTAAFILCSYFIMTTYGDFLYLTYDIHPRLTMFNTFQSMAIIPLALGLGITKGDMQQNIFK